MRDVWPDEAVGSGVNAGPDASSRGYATVGSGRHGRCRRRRREADGRAPRVIDPRQVLRVPWTPRALDQSLLDRDTVR
jgi:hypothetical protein